MVIEERREGGKEGRREGGKEGRREGGKEGRREGGKEGRREGGTAEVRRRGGRGRPYLKISLQLLFLAQQSELGVGQQYFVGMSLEALVHLFKD
jgi:hypothetical protein